MKHLPNSVSAYKQTPVFTQGSVPKGLLKAHQTKQDVWGKITINKGQLLYRILEPEIEEVMLDADNFGVVEPTVLHEVEIVGEVEFYVEFLKDES